MLILKVYSNNDFLGYLDIEKRDITRYISGARIFNDEEIEEVKNIAKRFSDYKIVKLELKGTGLKMDKNIYGGCGVISSELLKKNFEGFKQGEIVINSLKGNTIPFDIEKYFKENDVNMDDNNFERFMDKDRMTKCDLDLDLFQFESPLDKRKCKKFMPKDIYELSICKSEPMKNK